MQVSHSLNRTFARELAVSQVFTHFQDYLTIMSLISTTYPKQMGQNSLKKAQLKKLEPSHEPCTILQLLIFH